MPSGKDMPSPVVDAALRFRAALVARDARRAAEMVQAYGRIWLELQRQWVDIERAIEAGEDRAWIARRIRALQRQAQEEIARYASYADQQLALGVQDGMAAAVRDAPRVVQARYPIGGQQLIAARWNRINVEAVETLLGMLSSDSPLRTRMVDRLGAAVAEKVGEKLTEGIALGYNPRRIQAILRQTVGEGLEWSITATRTATMTAYREATRAQYAANPEIVRGWVWTAVQDERTCLSCLNMDGTEHPVTETLNDHHNGRCVERPLLPTYRELGIPVDEPPDDRPAGRQWFEAQPEARQRAMMGDKAWEAWRSGKFDLRDYSKPYQDEVYGEMLREATLEELLRDAAILEELRRDAA